MRERPITYDILCVISLAKPRCSGGQSRWTCELSGLCKVYNPKRWPAEGAVLFRPIMWLYSASVVLVWDSFLPFTLLWPYSSKVHLVLATAHNNKCHFLCHSIPYPLEMTTLSEYMQTRGQKEIQRGVRAVRNTRY